MARDEPAVPDDLHDMDIGFYISDPRHLEVLETDLGTWVRVRVRGDLRRNLSRALLDPHHRSEE